MAKVLPHHGVNDGFFVRPVINSWSRGRGRDETYRRAVIGGAAAWTLVEFAVYPVIVFLWRWRRFNTLQLAKAAIEDIEERKELV